MIRTRRAARLLVLAFATSATSAVCAFAACSSDSDGPVCPAGLVDIGGPQRSAVLGPGCIELSHQCVSAAGGSPSCYYEYCCPPVPDASDEGGDAPSE